MIRMLKMLVGKEPQRQAERVNHIVSVQERMVEENKVAAQKLRETLREFLDVNDKLRFAEDDRRSKIDSN